MYKGEYDYFRNNIGGKMTCSNLNGKNNVLSNFGWKIGIWPNINCQILKSNKQKLFALTGTCINLSLNSLSASFNKHRH